MKKIGLFIVYFGAWPRWFDLFLESCRRNADVHLFLFNEGICPASIPTNVSFERISLSGFRDLVSHRLGIPIGIDSPYKLCDFRPAFGDIFRIGRADLDFWGYCDLDIVFGNLRRFLTEDMLNHFDVISAAPRFMAGPFSLFRNTPSIRSLYRQSSNFYEVFTESPYKHFDELGPHVAWDKNGDFIIDKSKQFESFTDVVLAATRAGRIRTLFGIPYFSDVDVRQIAKGTVIWKDGHMCIARTQEEILFYHFQFGKRRFTSWPLPVDRNWKSGFLIKPNGFHLDTSGMNIKQHQ